MKKKKHNHRHTKRVLLAIFSLTLLGLIFSVILIRVHYQISINPGEKSFCNFSSLLDCDTVLTSGYAKLGPVFNAELSFSFHLVFILGLLCVWGAKKPIPILSFLFLCTFLSAVYSIGLNLLSIMQLGVICLLCLIISIIQVAVLMLLPLEMKTPFRELPGTIRTNLFSPPKTLFIYGIVAILLLGVALLYARRLNPNARYSFSISPESYLKSFFSLPQKEVVLPARPVLGNPKAQVTIVAFSDLQCAACRRAESVLRSILEKYQDRIRLVYLNYPLSSDCNPMVGRSKHHLMDCIATKEALCSYQHGKFSEYREWAFKNQTRNESRSGLTYELGIAPSAFENCLASEKTAALLREDIETAKQFNVQGNPSIFVNGRQFKDWPSADRLRLVLESELTQPARH